MSTDAKSALGEHTWRDCPLPGPQMEGSTFLCGCERRWISDGKDWVLSAQGEPHTDSAFVKRPPSGEPASKPRKGPSLNVAIDQARLLPGMHYLEMLVHDQTGAQWTLTLHVDKLAKGDQLTRLTEVPR